jgi:hypothetical protein
MRGMDASPEVLEPPVFTRCPKCGHAPLPADQASPAACGACGLILAKYSREKWRPPPKLPDIEGEEEGARAYWSHLLFDVASGSRASWHARALLLGAIAAWTVWIWATNSIRDGDIGSNFLHMILLPFHEAGHYAIFRWFGQFIMILGGTLGQHLLPIVAGYAFLFRHRDPFGAALCFWLLGFSTVDMAIYMYDAFDPKIMLLGGSTGAESDGHDWQNIFGDLGLLRRARAIGLFSGVLGYAMMVAGLAWAAVVVRTGLRRGDSLD